MKWAILTAAAAVGTIAAVIATGLQIVGGASRPNVRVARTSDATITFPASERTRIAGTFGLSSTSGELRGRIGALQSVSGGELTRAWHPLGSSAFTAGEAARWTGALHRGPEDLQHAASWTSTETAGLAWWIIEPAVPASETMSVHLHGLGASPASVLRSVDAALAAGMRALVPDLRSSRSTLGADEGSRVVLGIEQLTVEEPLVLVGWSMGAEVVRHVHAGPAKSRVTAALLISPVLDWAETVKHAGRRSRVPGWWMRLALNALQVPAIARSLGMAAAAAPLGAVQPGDLPPRTLAVHSPADELTPFLVTADTAQRGLLEVHQSANAPHTLEWNVDEAVPLIVRAWFIEHR